MEFQFVKCETEGDGEIAVLQVNDPPANTLTYDLILQLEDVFFKLTLEPKIRAIILIGAGERFFSGGVNIGMLRSVSPHYNSNFLLYASEVFGYIDTAPKLVVAAINGHATGGGLELALTADRRVAIDNTYNLGFPEVRLGVIPGLGGTQRLSNLAGKQVALELITHGDFISAPQAKQIGIVDEVFAPTDFKNQVLTYVGKLLKSPLPHEEGSKQYTGDKWVQPAPGFIQFERQGSIGVITVSNACAELTLLQGLWSLNQAILAARLDENVEAILLTHTGTFFRLGQASTLDETTWNYANYVFQRLEGFPRLCVLAFNGVIAGLEAELALACDYRFAIATDVNTANTALHFNAKSTRLARYTPQIIPGNRIELTHDSALSSNFLRSTPEQTRDSIIDWLSRFIPPKGASKAIGYAKFAILNGDSGVSLERHLQEQLFRGNDGPEGMQAYLEKRTPIFKGE